MQFIDVLTGVCQAPANLCVRKCVLLNRDRDSAEVAE